MRQSSVNMPDTWANRGTDTVPDPAGKEKNGKNEEMEKKEKEHGKPSKVKKNTLVPTSKYDVHQLIE